MFRKQTFFKKSPENSEVQSKCDSVSFKFKELSLDNILDTPSNEMSSNKFFKISSNNIKDKQRDFAQKLYMKSPQISSKVSSILNSNHEIQYIPSTRRIFFSNKQSFEKYKDSRILSKYILSSHVINSFKWLKYSINQQQLDVDSLISSASNKSEIKKLVPNKYCLGNDIIPDYLLKKTKKSKINKHQVINPENKFNSIVKAHKAHGSYFNKEMNLTFLGLPKCGKSTIIGNILLYLGALENSFIKKTDWDAKKMNSLELKTAWLVDTSNDERLFKETISTSSHYVDIKGKPVNLIDSPGNMCYYKEILKSIIKSHYVILLINLSNDWCWKTSELKNQDYLNTIFYIMKVFAIDKLELLFVNSNKENNEKPLYKIKSLWKKFFKTEFNHSIINNLSDIQPSEFDSLISRIQKFECNSSPVELDKPLLIEISDICKPVESALPVISGSILRGGISSGVNYCTSKGLILPEHIQCTVKSMKVQENDNQMKTKSFAFPGHFAEITLLEINAEEKVKKGSFICHPQHPLTIKDQFKVEMRIFDCNIDTPILRGMKVLLWSRCRSCFCQFTDISSVEYYENKEKIIKKFPRIINKSGCTVIANIKTEEVLAVEFGSLYKLDVFLLFSGLKLFAAGKFLNIIN